MRGVLAMTTNAERFPDDFGEVLPEHPSEVTQAERAIRAALEAIPGLEGPLYVAISNKPILIATSCPGQHRVTLHYRKKSP